MIDYLGSNPRGKQILASSQLFGSDAAMDTYIYDSISRGTIIIYDNIVSIFSYISLRRKFEE